MQLEYFTTFFVTGLIIGSISLATFFFSFSRKENKMFIWAAIAGFFFSVSFFLAGLR